MGSANGDFRLKREHKKKFKKYAEVRELLSSVGNKIEDIAVTTTGSYGEQKVDWLILFLDNKTKIVVPVIKDYGIGKRLEN